jgi:hypothetical protein
MRLLKYRFYPVFFVFLIAQVSLLNSCKMPVQEDREPTVEETYAGKEQLKFSAINAIAYEDYAVQAVRLAENDVCVVYGDYNAKVSVSTAEIIAREYAERIGPRITGVFGNYYPGDKRLVILLLDIIDGYDSKNNPTYVAGYFSMKDIFPKSFMPSSNEAPMLYLDINPGIPGSDNFYSTIAHEFQHLINFSSRYRKKNPDLSAVKTQSDLNNLVASIQQDDWVDEGLSSAAEYIYSKATGKGHIQDKIEYYNNAQDKYKLGQSNIVLGNNFFTWGENDTFVYDDYVTVYLFFQWLRIHANANDANGASVYPVYLSIIESEYTDYRAVTTAARKHIPGLFAEKESTGDQAWEWERLIETWLAANYVNAPKKNAPGGFWGYNGEIILNPVLLAGKPIWLYPGEGVYSKLNGGTFGPQKSPGHIRYAGLNKTEKTLTRVSPENLGQGDALLTFNANREITRTAAGVPSGPVEEGTLASVEPAPARPSPSGRAADIPAKPLPIDIRPPLRF